MQTENMTALKASKVNIVYRNYKPDIMTYARLGKTNLMVSRIGLGGYNNAENGANAHLNAKANPTAYRENLQYLVDNGVNLFDTAPDYDTEEDYGAVLGTEENRGKVFIITKVSRLVKDLETGEQFSRQEMEQEFRTRLSESLRRLRTNYVDMLLLHHLNTKGDDPYHNLGYVGPNYDYFKMAYDVINELIQEGLVNFKGFTSHYPDTTRDAVLLHGYEAETDVAIVKYTITRHFFQSQEPEIWEAEAFPALTQRNVGVIQMKALLSPHSPMNEKMTKIRDDARAFARIKPFLDQGHTPPQAMIRWALSKEAIHTCIVGMPRIYLAEEDLEAVRP